uniref:Uncharacterized protein n=1 Tax=Rhizophora mucronata TaxID=61149 RepID=A0A2P2QZ56_RHIMU
MTLLKLSILFSKRRKYCILVKINITKTTFFFFCEIAKTFLSSFLTKF